MVNKKNVLSIVLLVLVTLVSLLSVGRVLSKGGRPGLDFHSYWYPGHFIWQGTDPYRAVLDEREPSLPVYYLDGETVTEGQVAQSGWRGTPANTAPIVLLLAPLSRLSWPTALAGWQFLNLGLALLVPWLIVKLLRQNLLSWKGWLVLTVFFSLIATREALEYGQTSILILVCMLAGWYLGQHHPVVAGLLLGIALSKYSLAFPVFLLFVYKRWFKGLAVSIAVQLVGILAVATSGKTSPFDVIESYIQILKLHLGLPGMHLTGGILKNLGVLSSVILLVGSVVVLTLLVHWYLSHLDLGIPSDCIAEFNLVTIVMLWDLLVFYHRRYDNVAGILFVALVILCVHGRVDEFAIGIPFGLSYRLRVLVYVVTGLISLAWIMPTYLLLGDQLYVYSFQLANVTALAVSIWLLFKIRATSSVSISSSNWADTDGSERKALA